MKCKNCGTEFEGKFCPNCGNQAEINSTVIPNNPSPTLDFNQQKPSKTPETKKPFYKKWWFFVLVAVVVVAIVSGIGGGNKVDGEKLNWDDIVMGNVIPRPTSETAQIFTNSNETMSIFIYKTSSSDYADYIKKCEEKGFTVDADKSSDSFKAYNAEGYKLDVSFWSYGDTYMDICLDAPIEMTVLQWPSSTAGGFLPTPKSLNGKFSYEHADSFFVYIGNTSFSEYEEYVAACSDSGFNVDYDKGDDYYSADNSEGYHVSLTYEGNSIMSICIKSPDAFDDTSSAEGIESTLEPDTTYESQLDTITSESLNDDESIGIGNEFKEAMDSYEAFIDEYVTFMKKYTSSDGTDVSLIADYAKYVSKYADAVAKFEKWEDEELNAAETAYYIEVQARVSIKLLEVANDMG